MEIELCGTSFTGRKLEQLFLSTLRHSQNNNVNILDDLRLVHLDAEPIGIQGFLSKVLRVRLAWNQSEIEKMIPQIPTSVIVKCPTSVILQEMMECAFGVDKSIPIPDAAVQIRDLHNDECRAYKFLYGHGSPIDVPIPRLFGAETIDSNRPCSDGVLILEDLSDIVTVMKTIGEKLNSNQLECITDTLAALHASSYIRFNDPNRSYDQSILPCIDDRMHVWKQIYCTWTDEMVSTAKENYPHVVPKVNNEKIINFLSADTFLKYYGIDSNQNRLPVVLVHGDIQPMNMLLSNESDDQTRLIALIDWQMSHRGYGPEDLARLLIFATPEYKAEHCDDILRRYVRLFNDKIKHTSLKPIRFDDVKSAFEPMYAFMAMNFGLTVRLTDQLLSNIQDNEEKKKRRENYIKVCTELCRDAAATVGW